MLTPWALVAAVGIGISLGLLGGGGSILTVPALVYLAGLPPFEATSASLVVVGITSASAAVQHALRGRVQLRAALLFAAAGVPGSFAGSWASRGIGGRTLLLLFACLMIAAGVAMLARRAWAAAGRASLVGLLTAGLAVGALTGFFGIGGGFLIVPTLVLFAGVPMGDAVGTSVAVIACNCAGGFAARLSAGSARLDWPGTLAFSLVAVAGSLAGALLVSRLTVDWLRKAFGVFVIAVAVFMLMKELR